MAETQKVSIRIDVTDNAQPAIQGVTQSLGKMGEAGATSGAKVERAMTGMTAATTAARVEMDAMQARLRTLYGQVQALSPAGMKIFNEQVPGLTKAGMSPLEAQEAALARTAQLLEKTGNAAGTAANGYGEMRIAIGAATGNLRQIEFGLASVVGRMKGMQALFGAVFPALVAVGAIGMIVQMGEAVYELYEKWADTDGAIERYNQKAAEAAEKQFYQNSGLDQLNADLKTAADRLDALNKLRGSTPTGGEGWASRIAGSNPLTWMGVTGWELAHGKNPLKAPFTMGQANQLNQAQGLVNEATIRQDELNHRHALEGIRDKALRQEAALTGDAKARAEYEEKIAEAKETQAFQVKRDNDLAAIANRGKKPGDAGYVTVASNAGASEYSDAVAHAQAGLYAARIQNARITNQEILRLQHQADEASLTGIRLLEQQRKDADADFVAAHGQNAAALAAIDRKYFAEEAKLQDQQNRQRQQAAQEAARELVRMHDETLAAGLTGAARIRQQGQNSIREFQPTPGMNYIQYFGALHEIAQQTAGSLARESQSFADEVSGALNRTVDRSISGFARIHEEANREIAKLESDYAAKGGRPEDLARGEAGIRRNEVGDVRALQQRNREQTEALEAEARSRYLSSQKQQTQAIENEYEERLRRFKEELDQQDISQTDYNRRTVAAAQIRDAEIAENAKREREKMAGQFTSFFHGLDHPVQSFTAMGDKIGGEMAAALVQRLQNRGGRGGSHPEELSMDSVLGGLFGRIAGKPHGATAGVEELGISVPGAGAKKSIALATAEIFVQTATIGFAGAGFRGAGAPGGFSASSGTFLAASYPSGASGGASAGSTGVYSQGSIGTGGTADSSRSLGTTGSSAIAVPAAPGGNTAQGVLGDAQQAIGVGQQLSGAFGGFGKIGAGLNKLGGIFNGESTTAATKNGGMLGHGGFGANLAGAAGGALGLFSAYEGKGGVSGALGGALSGAKMGMAVGGPIGAAIGAGAGALMGLFGRGGREQARMYDLRTVRPHLAQTLQQYQTGGMTYLSAYSDVQSLEMDAKNATNRMGFQGEHYYQETIKGELHQAMGHLTAEERAGRNNFAMSQAQFHEGIDSVPYDMNATLMKGERVFDADQNERITQAIEGGADSRRMAVSTGFGGDVHLHVHTMDEKGVRQFLDANKHNIRAALNKSFAENSGGADGYI